MFNTVEIQDTWLDFLLPREPEQQNILPHIKFWIRYDKQL